MNSLSVTKTTGLDVNALPLVAKFRTTDGSDLYTAGRFCPNVVLASGRNPSYATIGIPVANIGPANWEETAPTIALKTNGPAGTILLKARATIGYWEGGRFVVVMNGYVVKHSYLIGEDSMVTTVYDDRWLMSQYTIAGKIKYNPENGRLFYTLSSHEPLIYCFNGHGDCFDVPGYGPAFSDGGHKWGHASGLDGEFYDDPEPGEATSKTRLWRLTDVIEDLRNRHAASGKRVPRGQDYGYDRLPATLVWSKGMASVIKENRDCRDFKDIDAKNLLDGLSQVIEAAGPYQLVCVPTSEFNSELKIVSFARQFGSSITVYGPKYGSPALKDVFCNATVAMDGQVTEDASAHVDNVRYVGDPPCAEGLMSTEAGDLYWGWDTGAEESAFKIIARQNSAENGDGVRVGDVDGFKIAIRYNPEVFSRYRMNDKKNPFRSGKWNKLVLNGRVVFMPHQLTSKNSAGEPALLMPYEVIVEVKRFQWEYDALSDADKAKEDPYWMLADRQSEISLSPDGRYILLPGLRDSGGFPGTFGSDTTGHTQYEVQYMTRRQVRINIAVRHEHSILACAGDGQDPYNTASRIDPGAPKTTLLILNEPQQYVDYTRASDPKSYPLGKAGAPAGFLTAFPAKEAENDELFTDVADGVLGNPKNRLGNHADVHFKNYKKICYQGLFVISRLTPLYQPGMQVMYEDDQAIPAFGVIKCVVLDANKQQTIVQFGPNEPTPLYDQPLTVTFKNNGSGAGPSSPGTPTPDKYDDGSPSNPSKTPTTTPSGGDGGSGPITSANDSGSSSSGSSGSSGSPAPSAPAEPAKPVAVDGGGVGAGAARGGPVGGVTGPKDKAEMRKEKSDRKKATKAADEADEKAAKKDQRSNKGWADTGEMNAANAAYDKSVATRANGSTGLKGAAYDAQRQQERGVGADKHVTGQGRDEFVKSAKKAKAEDAKTYDANRKIENRIVGQGVGPDRHTTGKGRSAFEASARVEKSRDAASYNERRYKERGVAPDKNDTAEFREKVAANKAAAARRAIPKDDPVNNVGGPRGPSRVRNEEDMRHDEYFAREGNGSTIFAGDALKARDEEKMAQYKGYSASMDRTEDGRGVSPTGITMGNNIGPWNWKGPKVSGDANPKFYDGPSQVVRQPMGPPKSLMSKPKSSGGPAKYAGGENEG